jgi:hypothetical protein
MVSVRTREDPLDLLDRLRTSVRLRLGRRYVQLRQAVAPARAAAEAAPDRDQVPIVVAGCHRSGTSLVRRILDSHSRIACPPETLVLEHLGAALSHPHAEKGFAAVGLDLDHAAADLGALVDRWMRAYAAAKGKPRWAEKSPATFEQLPAVDRMFRHTARFVLVVRDGRDVAHSLGQGRWWMLEPLLAEHGDPYVAAAHYWSAATHKLLAFHGAVPDRTLVLRYEALVDQPEDQLRALFAFLEEPWEPAVLDFNRFSHDAGFEDHRVGSTWKIEDHRGKHRELPPELIQRVAQIARPAMLALGYPDPAADPGPASSRSTS